MDAAVIEPICTETLSRYRCARCGIESPESTCFVLPERHGKPPHDIRCIACERQRLSTTTLEGVMGILRTTFVPLLVLVAIERGLGDLTVPILLAACLMSPLAIIAHELGHAVTGRLLGLEVSTVVIGVGPKIWREKIFGTWFTLHAWPLSGLTFLGSATLEFLRIRLWITTLMGPLTNVALAGLTALYWTELLPLFGLPILSLWCITNALLALQSLMPRRFTHLSERLSTDGLALLQIPRCTPEQLESYLFTGPLLRAYVLFENGDYASARAVCNEALERVPGNVHLRVLISTCRSYQHDYAGALVLLRPLLQSQINADSQIRVAIENNTAFALLMSDPGAPRDGDTLEEADQLSARVFALYPCVLPYRSTRALVLAATGRPELALALLEYSHYATADRTQRAHCETARAFALANAHRHDESQQAAAEAVKLHAETAGFLKILGVRAPPAASSQQTLICNPSVAIRRRAP